MSINVVGHASILAEKAAQITPQTFKTESISTQALAKHGYVIVPDFLAAEHCHTLYQYAQTIAPNGWQQAAIGRANKRTTNTHVRQDRIRWLNPAQPIEAEYLAMMETLRTQLNRELFMGLFDYECHLAHYPKGAFYRKHVDAFKGRSNRILSSVFYLNPDWQAGDGGELVIYGHQGEILERVLPEAGKLVLFLSDVFVHEVLAGNRDRYSITGWFRTNNSVNGMVDPTQ